MKSTVKRWCKDFDYTWYGPGKHGDHRYDYKIIFENNLAALFATAHEPSMTAQTCHTRNDEFLLFPVFSQIIGRKEMSKFEFIAICDWVKSCLSDDVIEFRTQQ
jgi:hypothetical protein